MKVCHFARVFLVLNFLISAAVSYAEEVRLSTDNHADWVKKVKKLKAGDIVWIDGVRFELEEFVGSGNSANIFRVNVEGQSRALKIPNDLEYGFVRRALQRENQLSRLWHYTMAGEAENLRFLDLLGLPVPQVHQAQTGFILMDYIRGPTVGELSGFIKKLPKEEQRIFLEKLKTLFSDTSLKAITFVDIHRHNVMFDIDRQIFVFVDPGVVQMGKGMSGSIPQPVKEKIPGSTWRLRETMPVPEDRPLLQDWVRKKPVTYKWPLIFRPIQWTVECFTRSTIRLGL